LRRSGAERQLVGGGRVAVRLWSRRAEAGPRLGGRRVLGNVEEQVLLRGKLGERRRERLLHLLEDLPAGPLRLGLVPRCEGHEDVAADLLRRSGEGLERGVGHDPRPRPGGEHQGLEVDQPLEAAVVPGGALEGEELRDVLEDAGAVLAEGNAAVAGGAVAAHVDLDLHVAERRRVAAR
jgi:hypothetical protein